MELKEVFEPIISFVKSFQKKEKDISKQAAKDRLKLVLMQDRASVSPDFFEMMKKEIIDVIKKYIEIDEESLEVQLTRGFEAGLEGPALYANIPIKNIKPVASNGEDINTNLQSSPDMVADEKLKEAEQKIENIVVEKTGNVIEAKIELHSSEESNNNDDVVIDTGAVEDIAKNVAKEMKKTTKSATTKSTTKTTRKSTTKKTVKKSATE